MAPAKPLLPDGVKAIKKLSDYAVHLQQILASGERPPNLATELYSRIDELAELRLTAGATEFDDEGTKLWNLSTRLREDKGASAQLVCLVRVFAWLLLDYGHRSRAGSSHNVVRVLRSALKTVKLCLDQGHLALAERVLGKATYYKEQLGRVDSRSGTEPTGIQSELSKEYCLMQIVLSWRQNRLDLAESWLISLDGIATPSHSSLTENLVDLLFEIGKDCNNKGMYDVAVQWLERAHDRISNDFDEFSSDAEELRNAVMHVLARALMKIPGEETRKKAWNIANDLDTGQTDKLAVLILKLDLYGDELTTDSGDYYDILIRIVYTMHVTDPTFKTALHYIHKLKARSPTLAHRVLEDFLINRLLDTEKPEWLERVVVTMVWNITTSSGIVDDSRLLQQSLDNLSERLSHPIGVAAIHAAHILLWKRIETSYSQELYMEATAWCRLSLHQVFRNAGELNISKMQRKLILCTLATSDFPTARSIYSEMSELAQTAQETQYLMYKLGLRSGDAQLANECLENIYKESTKDVTLLYACVLEAQVTGQRAQAVSAMQLVLERYDYGSPPGVHLPALLRCTARLLIAELEETSSVTTIEAVVKLFEGAATQAKLQRRSPAPHTFNTTELDWFSRSSYNLALKYCAQWSPAHTVRIVDSCLKIIDLYPNDMDSNALSDLSLRRMFCDFLAGSLLVVMAREEDEIETQLQYYLNVRKHAQSFRAEYQSQNSSAEGEKDDDLRRKAAALLSFDFEAAVRLKAWDDASQLVKESKSYKDPKVCSILADIILSSEAPTETTVVILQQIVNISCFIEGIDMTKLSRWIRCLFQLALTSKIEIGEFLLDQAISLARDEKMLYPAEELEWLATTTFNRAVDFYCVSQDEPCKRWAEKALSIAVCLRDGGELLRLLESKYLGLQWAK